MNRVIDLLVICALIALAKLTVAGLAVVLLILTLMSAIAHPRRTALLLACCGALTVTAREPAAGAGALGAVGVALVVAGAVQRRRPRAPAVTQDKLLLTYRGDRSPGRVG